MTDYTTNLGKADGTTNCLNTSKNFLKLVPLKGKYMNTLIPAAIVDNKIIEYVKTIRYLGAIIDQYLTLKSNVDHVFKKATR